MYLQQKGMSITNWKATLIFYTFYAIDSSTSSHPHHFLNYTHNQMAKCQIKCPSIIPGFGLLCLLLLDPLITSVSQSVPFSDIAFISLTNICLWRCRSSCIRQDLHQSKLPKGLIQTESTIVHCDFIRIEHF